MADNILNKITKKAKQIGGEIAFHVAAGMQKVNNEAFTGYGRNVGDGHELTINQQAETNRVARDLLEGVQSQAVQELAYRTALIEEESKDFEYLSESLALRYEDKYFNMKKANIDTTDERKVLFVQKNKITNQSIASSFKEIGMNVSETTDAVKQIDESGEETEQEDGTKSKVLNVGKVKLKGEHLINVTTNTVTKFQIGPKIYQIVVKENEGNKRIIDFYFSKYPNPEDWTSKPFVKELERIIFSGFRSSILDMKAVSFITFQSNGARDNLKFGFAIDKYLSGGAYEGWYYLRFEATAVIDGEDIMAPLYCESMAEKYRTKAPKEYVMHISPHTFNRSYVCEECGKVVELKLEDISAMSATNVSSNDLTETSSTDLDENGEFHTGSNVLSYYDMEIIEQTFGKKLCNDCFKKLATQLTNNTQEILTK